MQCSLLRSGSDGGKVKNVATGAHCNSAFKERQEDAHAAGSWNSGATAGWHTRLAAQKAGQAMQAANVDCNEAACVFCPGPAAGRLLAQSDALQTAMPLKLLYCRQCLPPCELALRMQHRGCLQPGDRLQLHSTGLIQPRWTSIAQGGPGARTSKRVRTRSFPLAPAPVLTRHAARLSC